MSKKTLFPGTTLDRKIPKKAVFHVEKEKNFDQLCQFFELNKERFMADVDSPWKELAEKMMDYLIPGFQKNASGNKKITAFKTDYDVLQDYALHRDFAAVEVDQDGTLKEGVVLKEKEAIHIIANSRNMTEGQVRACIDRAEKMINKHADSIFGPVPLSEELKQEAPAGWQYKNRKHKSE